MTVGAIRVILIEDHAMVREGLKLILSEVTDIAVVGEAGDGATGVGLALRLGDRDGEDSAGVVVTDVSLPDISGVEVLRRIKMARPDLRVLMLSMHQDAEQVMGLLEAGADGYMLKQGSARELVEAVRTVARGEMALSPALTRQILSHAQRAGGRGRAADALSGREREVLGQVATGLTSKEIALELGLRVKTVENHRANILAKLGVSNTVAAVGRAVTLGLLPADNR